MTRAEAASMLVKMACELRDYGIDDSAYHEAVAIACNALLQEQSETYRQLGVHRCGTSWMYCNGKCDSCEVNRTDGEH